MCIRDRPVLSGQLVLTNGKRIKLNAPVMVKLTSTVKRNARHLISSTILPAHQRTKDRRTVLIVRSFLWSLQLGFAAKVDVFLSKLFKPDELDNTDVRLNILTTTVSSNEESMKKLEKDVSDCLNFSFEHSELSNSQRQDVIWLIYRGGRYIKKWSPISLSIVDVKIASKALAYCFKRKLTHP